MGEPISRSRLHVRDRYSGQLFLVDTGADISLLPAPEKGRPGPSTYNLYAGNDTVINTFGETRRVLDLALWRPIAWNFCIADVPHPIIGADLIKYYGLIVDLKRRRLTDAVTSIYTLGVVKPANLTAIHTANPSNRYTRILTDFPEITGIDQQTPIGSRGVFHYLVTHDPPVSGRVRRLSPDKLRAAKLEFRRLCEAGICRPSCSPWASPIHMTKKKKRPLAYMR